MNLLEKLKKIETNNNVKKYLSWIGTLLSILGIVFIVIKLKDYSNQIDLSKLTISNWCAFIGLSIFYGCYSLLLAPLAWTYLLRYFGISIPLFWSIRAYGISQLAKYVPGNIFHLASRQAIGVSEGLPSIPLAKSTILDILLQAISAIFFGILMLPSFLPNFTEKIAFIVFICAILTYIYLIARYFDIKIGYAACLYTISLILSSILFISVLYILLPNNIFNHLPILSIFGAYVIAWLVGLVTPGAPGGAGVRELILYTLMHSWISQNDLLLAIIISRIITTLGDCVFYGISVILNKIFPSKKFIIPK